MKANRKGSDGEVDIENIRERKDNKQYTVLEKGRREGAEDPLGLGGSGGGVGTPG